MENKGWEELAKCSNAAEAQTVLDKYLGYFALTWAKGHWTLHGQAKEGSFNFQWKHTDMVTGLIQMAGRIAQGERK